MARQVLPVRFIKFGSVGLVGAAVNLAVLYICVSLLGLSPYIGVVISIEVSIINNFILNNYFTFTRLHVDRPSSSTMGKFKRFNLIALAGAAINYLVFSIGYRQLGLHYLAAEVVAIAAAVAWNYQLSVSFVWKNTGEPRINGPQTETD